MNFGLDILNMCARTKNEDSSSRFSKVTARTGQTDRRGLMHYLWRGYMTNKTLKLFQNYSSDIEHVGEYS